jgi:signal transduction histidine kinase/CheY-like chemotaxis protein
MKETPWILVVDDEPAILELVQDLLKPDYLVDPVDNPRDAQARLKSRPYDVVITDMVMPEVGGMEMVKFVKMHHPDTPVIVFTGFANFQDAVTAVKLGAFDYLTKPIQTDFLRHAIARALEFRRLTLMQREMEMILEGAETLGWQTLELLTGTPEAALLSSLREAGRASLELPRLAELVLEAGERLLGATRSSLFLYQADREQFVGVAARGPEAAARVQATVPLAEGIMGHVAKSRQPLLVSDIALDRSLALSRRHDGYQTPSFLIVPVMGSRFWGVLNFADRQDGSPFRPRELFLGWLLARLLVDFLESRQAETGLPEPGPMLRSLVQEHLPLGLAVVDQDLKVVLANQAMERLTHPKAKPLVGNNLMATLGLAPGDQEMLEKACRDLCRDAEVREFPILKSNIEGRESRFLGIKLIPSLTPQASNQILVLVEDVSEMEHLRQRLHLYEHLAIMGKLSLCVAHELNNPLDGIRRYLSLAQRKKDDPAEVDRYLGEALKGIQKMSLTIRSLLSSANPLKAPRSVDNLFNLLQDAVKIMMFQASDQRVQVDFHPSPELRQVPVEGDLYHVFINLIKNALQAMPQGGTLKINGGLSSEQVEITFTDNGPGLSAQELEMIFQPFYSTKEGTQGLGLGLPICRKILERYTGKLLVESEPGAGTCVRIILPRQGLGVSGGKE